VKFEMGRTLKKFVGENGKLTGVVLDNDLLLPAEMCVVGAGICYYS
jgi:hypothetical protein